VSDDGVRIKDCGKRVARLSGGEPPWVIPATAGFVGSRDY
jgi:hypothetical protein